MTGREKFEAALSQEGTPQFPAAICYHNICLHDHWGQITDSPWWARQHPDPAVAARPYIDLVNATGEDWFVTAAGLTRKEQQELDIECTPEGVFRVNKVTGERDRMRKPQISGSEKHGRNRPPPLARGVTDLDQLDAILDAQLSGATDGRCNLKDDGRLDFPRLLMGTFGADRMPMAHFTAPFWRSNALWGFDRMMRGVIEFPELIQHAVDRILDDRLKSIPVYGKLGPAVVWIEDCWTDMVSPDHFRRFNLDSLRPLTDAIRGIGMFSVHYFCGDPTGKWEMLLDTGADALALEESKKRFRIDIAEVAERVNGRMALLGNLDAYHVLERGSEEDLRAEITRQCEAGRMNRNRFIVSIGSPVTPDTPMTRVRRYCDLVHEQGCNS